MIKTKDPNALAATSIIGCQVKNHQGESLGEIEDFVVDMQSGRIAYAVLSFHTFLGFRDKLFAVPFQSLTLDLEKEEFILDADKEKLKNAPGFDRNNWPMMGNRRWGSEIHAYYGRKPYWESGEKAE